MQQTQSMPKNRGKGEEKGVPRGENGEKERGGWKEEEGKAGKATATTEQGRGRRRRKEGGGVVFSSKPYPMTLGTRTNAEALGPKTGPECDKKRGETRAKGWGKKGLASDGF